MQQLTWILISFIYCFAIQFSLSAETEQTKEDSTEKKELKTLILIIATDDKPAYRELQKIWEAYMNSDPTHFEAYFLRADPNLPTKAVINKNEIILKTTEGFVPGILNKSLLALEAMEPRLNEFDYVIRTNLSSFYYYPNLLKLLQQLPRTNCYGGVSLVEVNALPPDLKSVSFISGAGIILSSDLAKQLAQEHHKFDQYKTELPDDLFIGLFFQAKKIPHTFAKRLDFPTHQSWLASKDSLSPDAYHFRAKYSYNLRTAEDPYAEEIATLKGLLDKYYSTK